MRLTFEVKNYRCFPIDQPARFSIGHGFTALVGMNNAGKSSLLRFFYELRPYWARLSSATGNLQNALAAKDSSPGAFTGVRDQAEVFSNLNGHGMTVRITLEDEGAEETAPPSPSSLELVIERDGTWSLSVPDVPGAIPSADLAWSGPVLLHGGTAVINFAPWFDAFSALARALYVGPFRNALNAGAREYYDLNVGTAFIQDWNTFRSGPVKAQNVAALHLTDEIQRIFGLTQLDIAASADDTTLQLVVDGQPYHLEEVGGGLTHFIVVLAYAATRQPPFILIDEPELNLHASLQLDFLTTVGAYASTGVVFATHSLGLARAAGGQVYAVRRDAPGRSDVRPLEGIPRLAEFLGELGLSGYQELGFNKVLLVEGPTDVTLFQRLLRQYEVEHKVVLLPLGGGELINAGVEQQLSEVLRLTTEVFAVVDSERAADDEDPPAARKAFAEICRNLGITCHVLERRAVENYFTERAIRAIKGASYRALEPYERLKDANPAWAKAENWRIAGEMTKAELDATDLGTFLSDLANR